MSKKTNVAFCKALDKKLGEIHSMIVAGACGWCDGDRHPLAGDFDDRIRETVISLQNVALWATMHIPHHIGLTKRA